jgi:hypothetical protein
LCWPELSVTIDQIPRIYTSFAEFEREERARLGLPPLADPDPFEETSIVPVSDAQPPSKPKRIQVRTHVAHTQITPEALRAEGVLEVGCAPGTSVLYVRTRVKLHLLHTTWLPDRRLDDYAVALAMRWLEDYGLPSYEVASNFDVSETTLRQALLAAGYERALADHDPAKTRAKHGQRGNRRGRFMRREATHASP